MGLSLVAVGQGLVVNPNWIADARSGREGDIHLSVSAGDVVQASIPHKLWTVIDATPGWFNVT
jgi:2,4-dienoyl-CoA reductase-like NADH-dependent reductase (Old Yellow Enzyme family)